MSQVTIDDDGSDLEEEITPLEYARQNGIALDHRIDGWQSFADLQIMITEPWSCDEELPLLDFGEELKVEERLNVSKEAAMLLSSIARQDDQDLEGILSSSDLDLRRRKRFKAALPVLRTDHDFDYKQFRSRDDFEIRIQDVKLPLEAVDVEKDEGLTWSKANRKIGLSVMERILNEKLAVTRETIAYIQETTACVWTAEEEKCLLGSIFSGKKRKVTEPLTPPLMAWEPPQLYQPTIESEGFELPLLSDPPDLTKLDLETAENDIFWQDIPSPIRNMSFEKGKHTCEDTMTHESQLVQLRDIYSPLALLENSSPPKPLHERSRLKNFKVENVLTPKKPTFNPMSEEHVLGIAQTLGTDEESSSSEIVDQTLERAFGLTHEHFTRQLEQEGLVYADALCRVEIPKLDFVLPTPPWASFKSVKSISQIEEVQLELLSEIFQGMSFDKWINTGYIAKDLNRILFDQDLAKEAIRDDYFLQDDTWKCLVMTDENIADSSSITWKRPGLLICEDEDVDEDIEEAIYLQSSSDDLDSLVRKRKRDLSLTDGHQDILTRKSFVIAGPASAVTDSRPGLLGGPFSAQNSVDMFIALKGNKKLKLRTEAPFTNAISSMPEEALPSRSFPKNQLDESTQPSILPQVSIPAPTFSIPTRPFNIIISAEMYSKKSLVRSLERTLVSMGAIDRDFSAFNTSEWQPGSVVRSPKISPLASEADFIISPKVGIVVTTLQMISQAALPGQKKRSDIRDRVANVSLRYELLSVFVSEDNKIGTSQPLNPHTCQKLMDFIAFVAGIDSNIIVQYVPGDDRMLIQWLMHAIVKYKTDETLLAEETYWELFLRRAGMNAFAAQVVIAMLKAPEGVNGASPSKAEYFGLNAFVEMGRDARVARFGDICGVKLIERVGKVIDASWIR